MKQVNIDNRIVNDSIMAELLSDAHDLSHVKVRDIVVGKYDGRLANGVASLKTCPKEPVMCSMAMDYLLGQIHIAHSYEFTTGVLSLVYLKGDGKGGKFVIHITIAATQPDLWDIQSDEAALCGVAEQMYGFSVALIRDSALDLSHGKPQVVYSTEHADASLSLIRAFVGSDYVIEPPEEEMAYALVITNDNKSHRFIYSNQAKPITHPHGKHANLVQKFGEITYVSHRATANNEPKPIVLHSLFIQNSDVCRTWEIDERYLEAANVLIGTLCAVFQFTNWRIVSVTEVGNGSGFFDIVVGVAQTNSKSFMCVRAVDPAAAAKLPPSNNVSVLGFGRC